MAGIVRDLDSGETNQTMRFVTFHHRRNAETKSSRTLNCDTYPTVSRLIESSEFAERPLSLGWEPKNCHSERRALQFGSWRKLWLAECVWVCECVCVCLGARVCFSQLMNGGEPTVISICQVNSIHSSFAPAVAKRHWNNHAHYPTSINHWWNVGFLLFSLQFCIIIVLCNRS